MTSCWAGQYVTAWAAGRASPSPRHTGCSGRLTALPFAGMADPREDDELKRTVTQLQRT